jgi:hypothetical protein
VTVVGRPFDHETSSTSTDLKSFPLDELTESKIPRRKKNIVNIFTKSI